ncbi:MAG: glycosyltransferase [Burkholderiaceae bacterium]|nr:glycosyltransferase [Burkholderiaceae bacterium]MCD8517197.1 glycosyltransferase [Burkholderiaceae bacterium]MCD8536465.1 glycosyltransferase [Burkholderiaceae bacterium]MCD8565256.1 glycosyltransferase [Burkholderiaceae bacterium]
MTLIDFLPLLLVVAIYLLFWDATKSRNSNRAFLSLISVVFGVTYLGWRLLETVVLPPELGWANQAWTIGLWLVEVLAFIEVGIFLLIMSRTNERSAQADALSKRKRDPSPAVDIFIPTYNEPIDVLEKTIIGAQNIDWPNKKVWVLDDGRRDWLRDYCSGRHVGYLTRPDNAHAKAGNLNHALANTSGEFVCIFDADFVPFPGFVQRTIGFFDDPSVGIVQTPQHFYNKDPIQTNLSISQDYPDEQRLFFDEMAASRDAWDAAFCCGSCSIQRRAALDVVGGVPTESITEDLLSTLVMLRQGYKTLYLNERLSMGLAAESIQGFFVQRERWCRGAIQSLFLPSGPLGPGLNAIQRILFFPTSWLIQYTVRIMLILIPIVYLLTGMIPFYFTSIGDLVFFQAPVFLAFFLNMRWLVGGKYMPLVSVAASVFASFRMFPTVVASLIKPFGTPFKVTPKGSSSVSGRGAELFTFYQILVVIGLTVAGLLINVQLETAVIRFDEFYPIAVFWSAFNLMVLVLAALLCFEGPRFRREERFDVHETVELELNDTQIEGELVDASVDGCKIQLVSAWWSEALPPTMIANIPEVGAVRLKPIRVNRGAIAATFEYDSGQRDLMIAKLFSGRYRNQVVDVSGFATILARLWRRAFGN